MKVQPFLSGLLLVVLLAACCPAPLQRQATAFRAEVAGISLDASALHLKSESAPLTLVLENGVLRSSTGQSLPLAALEPGDFVYVQGTLTAGDLRATQVRRLE